MTINYKNYSEIKSLLTNYKDTKLLIVSKNRSVTDIESLMKDGANLFGENRVQEAKSKFTNDLLKYNCASNKDLISFLVISSKILFINLLTLPLNENNKEAHAPADAPVNKY